MSGYPQRSCSSRRSKLWNFDAERGETIQIGSCSFSVWWSLSVDTQSRVQNEWLWPSYSNWTWSSYQKSTLSRQSRCKKNWRRRFRTWLKPKWFNHCPVLGCRLLFPIPRRMARFGVVWIIGSWMKLPPKTYILFLEWMTHEIFEELFHDWFVSRILADSDCFGIQAKHWFRHIWMSVWMAQGAHGFYQCSSKLWEDDGCRPSRIQVKEWHGVSWRYHYCLEDFWRPLERLHSDFCAITQSRDFCKAVKEILLSRASSVPGACHQRRKCLDWSGE